MKRKLLAVLALCAALTLCACGNAAQKSAVTETEEEPEASWDAATDAQSDAANAPDSAADAQSDAANAPESESGAEAVFAPLVGTWTADAGVGILTVYPNGGFLFEAQDVLEGYLVYTDADGEAWESGPRYELYLENNERVPNCYFAFDAGHPGKLAYIVGGGAELFSLTNAVYDDDGVMFRAQWANDDAPGFTAYDGEDAQKIAFSTERVLSDFKFLAISWVDSNENGSFFSVEELYGLDALSPESPLTVQTSFPGDMPTNGVSFTDADGVTRYFAILESGYDGSLVVTPFKRSETP